MAAIASLSDLVNRLSGGSSGTPEQIFQHKQARIAGAAGPALVIGRPASLWLYDGSPCAGAIPTTVAIPDNTTAGGLQQTDPGGGREKFLTSIWACGLAAGTLILYDRLLHIGGFSGTSTSANTVGGSITRNTGGVGNFMFAEINTQLGTSATTITASYTDDQGNSGNTSTAVVFGSTGFRELSRAVMLPLASGDKGIQAVANVTIAATTGTAGNWGLVIGRPLAVIDLANPGAPGGRTWAQGLPGLPKIDTDACLAWLFVPIATTSPELLAGLNFVEA